MIVFQRPKVVAYPPWTYILMKIQNTEFLSVQGGAKQYSFKIAEMFVSRRRIEVNNHSTVCRTSSKFCHWESARIDLPDSIFFKGLRFWTVNRQTQAIFEVRKAQSRLHFFQFLFVWTADLMILYALLVRWKLLAKFRLQMMSSRHDYKIASCRIAKIFRAAPMPKSRRRQSISDSLRAARFAIHSQSSQESELEQSITRSPDRWRSRLDSSTSNAANDQVRRQSFFQIPVLSLTLALLSSFEYHRQKKINTMKTSWDLPLGQRDVRGWLHTSTWELHGG